MPLHSPAQADQRAADRKRNPPTHEVGTARPRIHVVCRTCASDDAAREAFGAEPFTHEVLTSSKIYAWGVWSSHRDAGHDVERLEVGA